MLKTFIIAVLVGVFGITALAQTAEFDSSLAAGEQLYFVVKTDGAEFYGFIKKDDGREILLLTQNVGKMYIRKEHIKSIKAIKPEELVKTEEDYGDLRTEGPFTTRYFLTTNALPIKKGENYAMLHLYGPEVHFSLSDNFSLGVMTLWGGSPLVLAGKYSFDSKSDVHFALGSMIGNSGYIANGKYTGGLHWATVTKGDRLSNISFSLGFAHINNHGTKSIGNKYSYQNQNGLDNLNYNEYSAAREALAADFSNRGMNLYEALRVNNTKKAGVLGVAGIHPVGNKASIIFDAMFFLHKTYEVVHDRDISSTITYRYYDYATRTENTLTRNVMVSSGEAMAKQNVTFLLMPGMRFNRKYGSAFQVELGMLSTPRSGTDYHGDPLNRLVIPLPMVSWLRTF